MRFPFYKVFAVIAILFFSFQLLSNIFFLQYLSSNDESLKSDILIKMITVAKLGGSIFVTSNILISTFAIISILFINKNCFIGSIIYSLLALTSVILPKIYLSFAFNFTDFLLFYTVSTSIIALTIILAWVNFFNNKKQA
ncbi:MAG: hypothetical protein WCK02_14155 [Bacteroidota bacterium]